MFTLIRLNLLQQQGEMECLQVKRKVAGAYLLHLLLVLAGLVEIIFINSSSFSYSSIFLD